MTVIRDPDLEDQVRAERQAQGLDRWDEVWDGVYVMPPLPNDEHQEIQAGFVGILQPLIKWARLGEVRAGVNVSDRIIDWKRNFRCPDVAVFLKGTTARNHSTFWLGGPDFAVEIVSPEDHSRDKLDFYAKVNVRELLIIDRAPWKLELYRLNNQELAPAGESISTSSQVLRSQVVPLGFQLIPGGARPLIEVTHHDGEQRWTI